MTNINDTQVNAEIKELTISAELNSNTIIGVTDISQTQINVEINPGLQVNASVTPNAAIEATITPGARGKSAYEVWLDEGHVGTPDDFLEWLRVSNNYTFIYEQMVPEANWTINHNMGKYPSATVVDSAGTWVVGDVQYITANQLIISFRSGFSGKAYLN